MKAAIIAVGSELLGPERLDTNSLLLTRTLELHGVELVAKSVVGDDESAIADELRRRAERCDLVLVTGGLGPTADDVTRPATAAAFDRRLTIDEERVEALRRRFAAYGRRMAEVNRRQAELLSGGVLLENAKGSAPGWRIEEGAATLFLFPGVPFELEAMIGDHLAPWLASRCSPDLGVERAVIKIAGLPESEVEERLAPAYERFGRGGIAVLASPGEVRVQLEARGSQDERRATLHEMRELVVRLGGRAVFSTEAEEDLEQVVGALLRGQRATVTTAESCTGGLVAERLTRVPGSSAYFLGGVVTYSDELKVGLLGLERELLARHGAVSEAVAGAMASGVRERYGSDYGLAVTGIAGPGGGSEAKPVGTVHLALAGPEGELSHRVAHLPGDRKRIRWLSSQAILERLRRRLAASAERSREAS